MNKTSARTKADECIKSKRSGFYFETEAEEGAEEVGRGVGTIGIIM